MRRRTALRALVDERLSAGSTFLPVGAQAAASATPCRARLPGVARRPALQSGGRHRGRDRARRLRQDDAPRGAESHEHRGCAWLSLDDRDNDHVVLLTYVALALDQVAPIDPTVISSVLSPSALVATQALPRFGRMLERFSTPFVLVLDDVHTVVAPESLDVLAMLVANLPAGCLLVLAGRAAPALKLGRLRVKRGLVEVGRDDLAFGPDEALTLYRELGMDLTDDRAARLVERTEGWPAALYLAALAHIEEGAAGGEDGPTSDEVGGSRLRGRLRPRTSCWTTWMPTPRRSCSAPPASSASPARCATPRSLGAGRPGCWRTSSAATCS